jgi:T-complex protein 1 subunit theta
MQFRNAGTDIMKEGTKYLSGLEQAVLRNIEAVKDLSELTRTSYGPHGLNKMVINHMDKLFVTHDAVTILKEVEIIHPAAKIVVMAAQAQETEIGDGTNFVVTFTGELLHQAETLIKTLRLHPSDIISGYKKALVKSIEVLENSIVDKVSDLTNLEQVVKGLRAGIMAKQLGFEEALVPLIAQACINVLPKKQTSFNVDNVRTIKIPGGAISDSYSVKGFILARNSEGTVKHVKNAKIACFGCNIDLSSLDSKETVSIKNAEELMSYSKREEKAIQDDIDAIASSGVTVVVSQGTFSEMAIHFLERHNIMAIRVTSKFDMRRLCTAIGATPLVRIGKPLPEEIGSCDAVDIKEIGGTKCLVFAQENESSKISTIVLRGPTINILDELDRAVDGGVNIYKNFVKDPRLVSGAGSVEIELYRAVSKFAEESTGMDQYSIKKFAEAFLIMPKALAESSGLNSTDAISNLITQHEEGKVHFGVDIYSNEGKDAVKDSQDNKPIIF